MADQKISQLTSFTGTPSGTDLIEVVIGGVNYKMSRTKLMEGIQAALVSGTNIKTVNGNSLLGSGDIVISGGGAVASVNGQTGVVVLDTGDIAEVTDKNYVTDAEAVVIGNTSGTNTGDQDISIFPRDILFDVVDKTHTGTLTATIVSNQLIEAGKIKMSSAWEMHFAANKSGTAGNLKVDFYLGPNSNSLTGATQIATVTISAATLNIYNFQRLFYFDAAGLMKGAIGNLNTVNDFAVGNSGTLSFTPNAAVDQYLMTVFTAGSTADTSVQELIQVTSNK